MGHSIMTCKFCGSYVMEGRNDWDCDCGMYCGPSTNYVQVKRTKEKKLECITNTKKRHPDSYEECTKQKIMSYPLKVDGAYVQTEVIAERVAIPVETARTLLKELENEHQVIYSKEKDAWCEFPVF